MAKTLRGQQERLKAVEILLLWEGQVSRPRLSEIFDVHGTLLSRDMARYAEQVPDNCQYHTGVRGYVLTPYARPQLTDGHFRDYEGLVGTLPRNGLRAGVDLISTEQHATPVQFRPFSRIHAAIRECKQICIEYRSLTNPAAHERILRPHAFIQAGPRWHVRAFCERAGAFRDFNLGRIVRVGDPVHSVLPGPEVDQAWNTQVTLRLVAHPGLSVDQVRLIRDEYMSGTSALVFDARQAIVKYIARIYGAAIDIKIERPPQFLLAIHKPNDFPRGTFIEAVALDYSDQ